MKHTKGPWSVYINGQSDIPIRIVSKQGTLIASIDSTLANARLIAAAPELLEIVHLMLQAQECMRIEANKMPKSYEAPKSVDALGIAFARAATLMSKLNK